MPEISASAATLEQIPIDRIDRNPENPRIIFRGEELNQLLKSIRKRGVQVPISVYKEGSRFVLVDGERRWRCALKLNRKTIPALIQKKPDRLTNLLLMFNIHALREQWDLLTMASKLPSIIELLREAKGANPTEAEISEETSLKRSTIRRCKLLMGLPQHYVDDILVELKKPKNEQKLTEDFFIEMERGLKTVERALPQALPDGDKDKARRILIKKFQNGVIENRVHFRNLPKIARATEADEGVRLKALRSVFADNKYSLASAYDDSVAEVYAEKDVLTRVSSLMERIQALEPDELDEELKQRLRDLERRIHTLLEEADDL
jgi:ParB family transcriptional regulator, chromosome partitioning protein